MMHGPINIRFYPGICLTTEAYVRVQLKDCSTHPSTRLNVATSQKAVIRINYNVNLKPHHTIIVENYLLRNMMKDNVIFSDYLI